MTDEEEFEPSYGLPELLPRGERLLWQGSPRWQAIARDTLHIRGIAIYFAAMLAWRGTTSWSNGATALQIGRDLGGLALLSLAALALLVLLAWLIAKTSIYTITNKRVAMRIGVVLSITFNLPYCRIAGAGLRLHRDGTGEIPLQLAGPDRIAYLNLWPHARPWKLTRTQPMMRGVPEAHRVATLLSAALADSAGMARPTLAAATVPETVANDGTSQQPLAA